jgi:hypothetical protein
LAFLFIAALGYPLRRLTDRVPFQRTAHQEVEASKSEVRLRLTCTAPLLKVAVVHLGEPVLEESAPGAKLERMLKIAFPEEGVDLQVQAEWAPGQEAALRVQLTDPNGEEHDRTFWGNRRSR